MLYCDLDINGINIWSGALCLNLMQINGAPYLAFSGTLYFNDTQGGNDPDYTGLNDRYVLLWIPAGGDVADAQQVPLQAVPNQQVSVALGDQNCSINLYTRTATLATS
jgi:hypothetical protein